MASPEKQLCPVCGAPVGDEMGAHIRSAHGETALRQAVLATKRQGMPDVQIGAQFGISFRYLEEIITEAYGANVSLLGRPKRVRTLQPKHFQEERGTVWSFKQRGNWATHDGRYRGNWSPYIPRNIVLKYSQPGDLVLDYFVGGGTTAIEAKLLGRRCIARDINPEAIALTRNNLAFPAPVEHNYEPEVSTGDARALLGIPDESVDLICAHPPYAGIINYSLGLEGDLSRCALPDFLAQMGQVAGESYRVLRPGGKCAILIGDTRQAKRVVPIGFQVISVFLEAGFVLRELIIKRQHNCKTTGFWYTRSIQHNFLLLAHEYLPVFEKAPYAKETVSHGPPFSFPALAKIGSIPEIQENRFETTTVWLFPAEEMSAHVLRNLLRRFAMPGTRFAEIVPGKGEVGCRLPDDRGLSLLYLRSPERLETGEEVIAYRRLVGNLVEQAGQVLSPGGTLAIETRDVRLGTSLWPMGLFLWEDIHSRKEYANKEIVVVAPEGHVMEMGEDAEGRRPLEIVHRYLLIFTTVD